MATNYVDTDAIDSQAEELKATVGAICSTAEEIASQCNSICNCASEYVQYNGYFDENTIKSISPENGKTTTTYNVCQKFILSDGGITSKAQKLQQKVNELSAIMVVLKQDSDLLKQVAAAIASNINSTNVALTSAYSRANGGGSLYIADEKFNTLAYGALAMDGVQKANLARSAEDIKNRNFLNYSDVKDNGLSGKMLQFRAQPDGTYKVYTIDGEDTGYYTTFTAANNYQRTLKRELLKGDKNYVEKTYSNNGSVDTKRLSKDTAKVATGSDVITQKTTKVDLGRSKPQETKPNSNLSKNGIISYNENKETGEYTVEYDPNVSPNGMVSKTGNSNTGNYVIKYSDGSSEKCSIDNGVKTVIKLGKSGGIASYTTEKVTKSFIDNHADMTGTGGKY